MTEWHGIKVGSLYKQTGRGSRGAPLLMVTALNIVEGKIGQFPSRCEWEGRYYHTVVTALQDGKQKKFSLTRVGALDEEGNSWPYVEVAL